MAERFGGKFSPGAAKQPAFAVKTRSRVGARVNLLLIAPLPLAIRAFTSEPVGLALNLVAFGILILAAWLTREGLKAEEAFNARKVARKPAFPRKMVASVLTGLGLGLAGWAGAGGVVNPLIFAVLGAALHSFSMGIDPLRDKVSDDFDSFQTDRVARAVDEAEKHLSAMTDAIRRLGDRHLADKVTAFQATAREMFRTVEDDPRDLSSVRKYLGVYLLGARDATTKFAEIYAKSGDQAAKADYEALLEDLGNNFTERTKTLLNDDRTDLDVEISVLRDRLAREGLVSE